MVHKEREYRKGAWALLQWKYLTHAWLFIIANDCSPLRKPQEYYSLHQREDSDVVCLPLDIYSSIGLFLFCTHGMIWKKIPGIPIMQQAPALW